MKAILGLLILFLSGSFPNTAMAQTEYVRDVWPELLALHPDPWAAPIQWFINSHTAIGNVPNEQLASARLRLRRIQAEALAHPEIEWAGLYTLYATQIGHVIFAFAPQSGYVAFETVGCGSAIQNVITGNVHYQQNRLKILPEYNDSLPPTNYHAVDSYVSRAIKFDITYIPVKWGNAYFLVEEKQIAIFCQDFIAGRQDYSKEDAPFVRPLMKFYGQVKDDTLAPVVPPKYTRLAKRPIVATVTETGKTTIQRDKETEEDWQQISTFVINKGAIHGVKKGMGFITLGRDSKEKTYLEIIRVGKIFSISQHTLSIPSETRKSRKELKSYLNENAVSLSGKKMRSYSLWYNIEGI